MTTSGSPSQYRINEIFYSMQGEGVRAGTMNVFVRFSKCNLKCSADDSNGSENNVGFWCDTEFESGQSMTLKEIKDAVYSASPDCCWLVLTGGEPALQLDAEFCLYFRNLGYKLAIETNGTFVLPKESGPLPGNVGKEYENSQIGLELTGYLLDWICVSPKSAEHTIKQVVAHEVKYVRAAGQALPKPSCRALHYVLSPAFSAVGVNNDPIVERGAFRHCADLCRENPVWRLSVQMHKFWRAR